MDAATLRRLLAIGALILAVASIAIGAHLLVAAVVLIAVALLL